MQKLKAIIFFSLFLINSLFCVSCHRSDSYDYHNKPISLADYRGKWIVINYWAAWCKPCLKELPELNEVYLITKNKVIVLGVNFDRLSNQELAKAAQKMGITFPLLSTFPLQKLGVSEINTVPMTFIIAPDGKLFKTLYGPQTGEDLLDLMGFDHDGKERSN